MENKVGERDISHHCLFFKVNFYCGVQLLYIIVLVSTVQSEKAMAPHSNTLAWKIPWTEEPGGLPVHGVLYVSLSELNPVAKPHFPGSTGSNEKGVENGC